jgi:hypothetical protein
MFHRAELPGKLKLLNEAMPRAIFELMDALEKCPSDYARELETVIAVQNNMMHVCNRLREVQGRATLLHMLKEDVEKKRGLLSTLREKSSEVKGSVGTAVATLVGSGHNVC